jgi:hypothetical protein
VKNLERKISGAVHVLADDNLIKNCQPVFGTDSGLVWVMKKIKTVIIVVALMGMSSAACTPKLEKVEFDKACGREKVNENITVEGYISNDSISCSPDISGKRTCSFTLSENLNENEKGNIFFSLAEGRDGNQVETPESGGQKSTEDFSRENIKIRGGDGSIINIREKVAVSGKTNVLISATMAPVCQMDVININQ